LGSRDRKIFGGPCFFELMDFPHIHAIKMGRS
jgi:hypothetical protein